MQKFFGVHIQKHKSNRSVYSFCLVSAEDTAHSQLQHLGFSGHTPTWHEMSTPREGVSQLNGWDSSWWMWHFLAEAAVVPRKHVVCRGSGGPQPLPVDAGAAWGAVWYPENAVALGRSGSISVTVLISWPDYPGHDGKPRERKWTDVTQSDRVTNSLYVRDVPGDL